MNLTVSIGVAGANSSSDLTSAQLYKNADTRLYIAKHTGRNQVSADEIVHLH
jgi:diguanylate cyclase (GGDEF)-like protein